MANRRRLQCYICNNEMMPQQMARIDRDDDLIKREIAVSRRNDANRGPIEITAVTRLCNNCNISIVNEIRLIQEDPAAIRLNMLRQTSSNTCCVCQNNDNLRRLNIPCRVKIYLEKNIYASENTRVCQQHSDENGFLSNQFFDVLQFVNRPVRLNGHQFGLFLSGLRTNANNILVTRFDNENNFSEEKFASLSPITRDQFRELYTTYFQHENRNGIRNVSKRDLLAFLCKLKQGASDGFLATTFEYSSRQAVSMAITTVRNSLMERFVPENVGLQSMERQAYIDRHVTDFANHLYNPEPNIPQAITYIDGTYLKVEVSSNFQVARQSYSTHKKYYLLKPALVIAPDGYILDVHGPYFSDTANNDAAMLNNELEKDDQDNIRDWFEVGDICVLDRGYRDVRQVLEEIGVTVKMPPLLERNQRQFTTEQANMARIIAITRWIIESRNGHLKSIFKFFKNTISVIHASNLREYLKIAAAIINRYKGPIHMENANAERAQLYLHRARQPNEMQARLDADNNLKSRVAGWVPLQANQLLQFPRLTLDYLRDFTAGVYQLNLAPAYIQDKLARDNNGRFDFDQRLLEPNLIRLRIFSRFRRAYNTNHQLWISFEPAIQGIRENPVLKPYCTCKVGARSFGCCAHVAAAIWFLGYARHEHNIRYPPVALLEQIQNARMND